jgi:cobalt-zinc-cadmium efflux system membrane fusion protein
MKHAFTVLLAALFAHGAGAAEIVRLTAEQRLRAGIETAAVEQREFVGQVQAVGLVTRSPGSMLTVKTITAGRVESLQVAPGEPIARDQVAFMLHSHDLLSLQSELLMAIDRMQLMEQRLVAARELVTLEGISRLELERREQEALSERLRVDTLREEILDHGFPEEQLEEVIASQSLNPHLPVVSPVDGVVLEVIVQEQEWVQAYAPLLTVGDPGRVELELQIAPDRASSVATGDSVEFHPVGRRGFTGLATVITRVPQIDPSTRTVRIRATIDNCAGACFPGAFVEATVRHGAGRTSLAVPVSAVINVEGQDSVFVASGVDGFEVRSIRVVQRDGDVYEVAEGLEPGEVIAVEGAFFLKSALVKGEGEEE